MMLLGMPVRTIKGAEYCGTVVAEFHSLEGNPHVVVEATTPGFRRSMHVYPALQVEPWPEPQKWQGGQR